MGGTQCFENDGATRVDGVDLEEKTESIAHMVVIVVIGGTTDLSAPRTAKITVSDTSILGIGTVSDLGCGNGTLAGTSLDQTVSSDPVGRSVPTGLRGLVEMTQAFQAANVSTDEVILSSPCSNCLRSVRCMATK